MLSHKNKQVFHLIINWTDDGACMPQDGLKHDKDTIEKE